MAVSWDTGAQIRLDLMDAFVEAAAPQTMYRAVFSPLPVPARVGSIKVAPFSSIATAPTTITRTPNTEYAEAALTLTSVLYECSDVGLQMSMDLAEQYPLNMEMAAAQTLKYKLEGAAEAAAVDVLFNATTGAVRAANGNIGPLTTPWNDPSATPLADIAGAIELLAQRSGGLMPDTLVVSSAAFVALKQNPDIVSRVPITVLRSDEEVANALAPVFGLQRIVVSRVMQGSTPVYPEDIALLAITAPANSLESTPAACRLVYWADDGDISREGWVVESYDKIETRSHIIRARRNAGYLVISANGLYGLTGVIGEPEDPDPGVVP